MAFVGTGKLPVIDMTAQDVTPSGASVPMPLVIPQTQAQPKKRGVNWGTLLTGFMKGNGRKYESVTPSVPTVTQPQAVNVPPIVDTQLQADPNADAASFTDAPKP